jgi:hypothetical protein
MENRYRVQPTLGPARSSRSAVRRPTQNAGSLKSKHWEYKRLFREDIAQNIKTDVMPYLSDLIVHSCIVSLAIAFLSLLQAILALSPRFFSEMKITTIALNFLIAYSEVAIIVGCTFIISQRLLKLCNVGPVIRWFLKRRWRQYVYFFV